MVCRINYLNLNYLNLNYLKFNYLKLGKIAQLSCFAYQPVSREDVGCFEVLLRGVETVPHLILERIGLQIVM